MTTRDSIDSIQLTEEEIKLALWQAKICKYHREKNAEYWRKLEEQKPKKHKDE